MLSRTADHLFWMARYMERAENTARMLDVNYQTSMLPQSAVRTFIFDKIQANPNDPACRSLAVGHNGAPERKGPSRCTLHVVADGLSLASMRA